MVKITKKTKLSFGYSWHRSGDDVNIRILLNDEILFQESLNKLMELEKKRLGLDPSKLVFIGMANFVKYYWCAWQYYLKSLKGELEFFNAYFQDRISYLLELGLLKEFPKNTNEILQIGDNIKISDIDKLLIKRSKKFIVEKYDSNVDIANYNSLEKGEHYQNIKGEKYPKIRWNFKHNSMIFVGIPDGITDDLIYEFKYTAKNRYLNSTIQTAKDQADFYGLKFKRSKKRVQVYCEEDDTIKTFENKIETERVLELVNKWEKLKDGELPIKPQAWKCNICEFKDECELLKK